MRAPARALAERGWGAFYESAEGGAAGSEIQPYLGDAGLGDPAFRVTLRVGGAL